MDLLGYAAFSGVERVAIIGGALVIGYWGYRLYGRDKTPGLIFMGIACAVLIASLATGGSHMRSVGASYQLAGGASGPEAGGELLGADAPEMSADVEAGIRLRQLHSRMVKRMPHRAQRRFQPNFHPNQVKQSPDRVAATGELRHRRLPPPSRKLSAWKRLTHPLNQTPLRIPHLR